MLLLLKTTCSLKLEFKLTSTLFYQLDKWDFMNILTSLEDHACLINLVHMNSGETPIKDSTLMTELPPSELVLESEQDSANIPIVVRDSVWKSLDLTIIKEWARLMIESHTYTFTPTTKKIWEMPEFKHSARKTSKMDLLLPSLLVGTTRMLWGVFLQDLAPFNPWRFLMD